MGIPKSFVRLIKWFYDTFMNPLPDYNYENELAEYEAVREKEKES